MKQSSMVGICGILAFVAIGIAGQSIAGQAAAKKKRAANPVFAPIQDDPALPRVLLIGDSISIGYTLPTRKLLEGKANVHRIPTNGGPTTNGLKNIDKWLGDGRWDVIHFNWGLHDLKFMEDGKRQVPLDAYEKNLRALVTRLKRTGARLIWASTTPVPEGGVKPPRLPDDVVKYNAVAKKIMDENGVAIDDLYAFALPQLKEIQRPANVHFIQRGSEALAGQVAKHILAALAKPVAAGGLKQVDVFVAGADGYHTYRIPSVILTQKGTLLAFCEGRKNNRSDTGDIDLVLKRSTDRGATWSPMQIVAEDGPNTMGNPCPVIDRDSGTIWLLLTHNLGVDREPRIIDQTSKGTRTVWVTKSIDDGRTWSKPVEITETTKQPNWTWYATGPGVGIQLRSGRLVIPCDHIEAGTKKYFSHIIYSDDRGATWKLGGSAGDGVNECQVVELDDGSLLLNMRNYHKREKNMRALATSKDGGLTWSAVRYDPTLVEPICQASFLRYTIHPPHDRDRVLFSNPAGTKREKMTVRLSYDEGKTWPVAKVLHAGPAAYSCLTVLPDTTIGCFYERGEKHPYETITFARFDLRWLTGEGAS